MESSNKFIQLKEVFLYGVDDTKIDLNPAATVFVYFENIDRPFTSGILNVTDSGENWIAKLPIQGGEKVEITLLGVDEQEYSYELYVWKVFNRSFNRNTQNYSLALISKQGIFNEGVRLTTVLEGSADTIVTEILTDYLDTDASEVSTLPSKYAMKLFPNGLKAHAVIETIASKAVPQFSSTSSDESNKNTEKTDTSSKTSLPTDTNKASGTAGYLFFQNRDGFQFKPVDYFFSDGSDSFGGENFVETYESRPIDNPSKGQNRFVIEEYTFENEINMFEQMRTGVYSTYNVFYNFSTGSYEEYTYNYADSFDNMAHLGSQQKLGKMQKKLSEFPTRITSTILDHEMWYSGLDTGSNEEKDGGGSNNPYPDFAKQSLAQSLARYNIMSNQKLQIKVPGNVELKAGDKIKVLLPNMGTEEVRQDKQYDEENSGTYLISAVGHNIDLINSQGITMLMLIRDTSGMKEYSSNVKS